MAIKFILLVLAVGAAYWLFFRRPADKRPDVPGDEVAVEKMVICAYCSLHFPLSESIKVNERYYCCDEHRALDQH